MDTHIPPPSPRTHTKRLTDKLRAIKPSESVLLDKNTAACLRAYGRQNGWRTVQREEGKMVRVWRLEGGK